MVGSRYSISGKVAPAGPLVLDEGHWAGSALAHAWVFNQQTRVVDLVTGAKGTFVTTPNANNRVSTRWGPGYQLGAQGSSDYIKTLVSASDCRQGAISIILGFSNYTTPTFAYVNMAVREPQASYTYGAGYPSWVVEADSSAVYWDNGNSGGEQTRATGPGGGVGVNAFVTGRDNLNIVAVTDDGTTPGTNIYINNGLMAQFSGSGPLIFGTSSTTTDSIQFGNTWVPDGVLYQKCCFHFAYIFKRGLSRLEIASLSTDPYQFWMQENIQTRLLVPTPTTATVSLTGVSGTTIVGVLGKALQNTLASTTAPALVGALAGGAAVTSTGTVATGAAGSLNVGSVALAATPATASPGALATTVSQALTASAATGSVGAFVLAPGSAVSGVAGTSGLGTVSWTLSRALAGLSGASTLGAIQAQGSLAGYLLGTAAAGSPGLLGFLSSSGSSLSGVLGQNFVGNLLPELTPRLFGNGGTGHIGAFSLSGAIIAEGEAFPQGVEAGAMLGDLIGASTMSADLSGTTARGGVGGPVVTLPGVWIRKRFDPGTWVREF